MVVGAGIIGLSVGWRLAQRGVQVAVLDRGASGSGTSWVAAGMLAPVTEATYGEDALLALNLESARRYPAFYRELFPDEPDPLPDASGTLFVALDRDQAEALRRLHELQTSLGLGTRLIDSTACRSLEPALHPSTRAGIDAAMDQAVDPRRLCQALASALVAAGGRLIEGCEVTGLAIEGSRAAGVLLAGGGRIGAGHVVLCAGCWSGGIGGVPPEIAGAIRPVKGQILRLKPRTAGPRLLNRVIRTEEVYLVPRSDGSIVAGATVEEQGYDVAVTAGATFELLRAAIEAVPGIRELEVAETLAGLRPGTPDNGPMIGPSSLPRLIAATGHFRNGVLLAPITADAVSETIISGSPPPEVASFSPQRFRRLPGDRAIME